jgi:lambda family phage portal protein
MIWLDKIISWALPAAGLKRAHARAMQQVLLSYEGVRSDRRQGGWFTQGTSGNAEIGPAVGRLRDNSEDLARNNAFASKSVRRWSRRVVGYGITPQADTGNDVVNAKIDAKWKAFVPASCSDRRINAYAAMRMIVRTTFVRGECLIRLWDRRPGDGLPVPFQFQVLEPDYLDSSKTMALNSGYIIQGVQFDMIGRIQGYWLYGYHPGDVIVTSLRGLTSAFVPAEQVIHHAALERPGDVRAVGRLAPIIAKLRDLDEVGDAKIMRTKIEACLAMFVGQPEGAEGPTLGPVNTITDGSGAKIEEFRPGMIAYGGFGQKPEFFSPTGSGDWAPYKKTEVREICAGMDQPYVVIGEDLEAVNYSSFRGGAIDERDSVDEYRYLWLIPQVLDRIWAKFIDTLVIMGEIPEANYAVKWNPPPFDLLDRHAEAEADRIEMLIGKTTWPQLVGNQGQDPNKQIAEITKWKGLLEAAGITFAKTTTESVSTTNTTGAI